MEDYTNTAKLYNKIAKLEEKARRDFLANRNPEHEQFLNERLNTISQIKFLVQDAEQVKITFCKDCPNSGKQICPMKHHYDNDFCSIGNIVDDSIY